MFTTDRHARLQVDDVVEHGRMQQNRSVAPHSSSSSSRPNLAVSQDLVRHHHHCRDLCRPRHIAAAVPEVSQCRQMHPMTHGP